MIVNYSSSLDFIIYMNLTLFFCVGFVQMTSVYIFSERRQEELYLWRHLPLMSIYTGLYLRMVRSRAYIDELVWKKSYDDPWKNGSSSTSEDQKSRKSICRRGPDA